MAAAPTGDLVSFSERDNIISFSMISCHIHLQLNLLPPVRRPTLSSNNDLLPQRRRRGTKERHSCFKSSNIPSPGHLPAPESMAAEEEEEGERAPRG